MKRFLIILLLDILAMNLEADDRYHTLDALWKEYYAALKADRPAKQAEVLQTIKVEAKSRNLPWDYYDASIKYVDAALSVNWKLRDSLRTDLEKGLSEFGCPILPFHFRYVHRYGSESEALSYAIDNSAALRKEKNSAFYGEFDYGPLYQVKDAVRQTIRNDYEYALWVCACRGAEDCSALETEISEKYPAGPFLEYLLLKRSRDNVSGLERFASDYSGKAVSLLALSDLLEKEFTELENRNAGSEDYKAFRSRCREFEKTRASFKNGTDKSIAACLESVKGIMERMDESSIEASAKDGELTAFVRNVPELEIDVLKDGKTVSSLSASNPKGSYYAVDTISVKLGNLDDGEYKLKLSGAKAKYELGYQKYTLSVAGRRDADGVSLYVADFNSGEPVSKADISICGSNGKVISTFRDFEFGDFKRLPDKIAASLSAKGAGYLYCSMKDDGGRYRRSGLMYLNGTPMEVPSSGKREDNAVLLFNCSAFAPGDTLHYKAILYHGGTRPDVFADGTGLDVILQDPQGNEVLSERLYTNDFGSAAGKVVIPKDRRNGMYTLIVKYKGNYLCSRSFRVDEFVLPSFTLEFDEPEGLCFSGDTLRLTGRIKSYSGHSISAAKARYELHPLSLSGSLDIEPDGSFHIDIKMGESGEWFSCRAIVTVTDPTGETHEFSKSLFSEPSLSLSLNLVNKAEGEYSVSQKESGKEPDYESVILDKDEAVLSFNLGEADNCLYGTSVQWRMRSNADIIAEGQAVDGQDIRIDLSGVKSGKYVIEAKARAKSSGGKEFKAETGMYVILLRDSDSILDARVSSLFKTVESGDIHVRLGAGDGPLWANISLVGTGGRLLLSKMVHLEGEAGKSGSLEDIRLEHLPTYPDEVKLVVFFFRDGLAFNYSKEYRRKETAFTLPLCIERYTDRALPSSLCKVRIKTEFGVECTAAVFDKSTETIMSNRWYPVTPYYAPSARLDMNYECGRDSGNHYLRRLSTPMMAMTKASNSALMAMDSTLEEESAPLYNNLASGQSEEPALRTDFSPMLAFEPHLLSDASGNIDFEFRTSGKLSTFCLQLFAHDKSMRNAAERKELSVSIPVKVSLFQPGFLYEGDDYVLAANVSNLEDRPVSGKLEMSAFGGAINMAQDLIVPAAGSSDAFFRIHTPACDGHIDVKLIFRCESFSDAISVSIPVLKPLQTLVESHSAVLLDGMSKDALLKQLRDRFVNTSSYGAEYSEISILDMIKASLPDSIETDSRDIMSLTDAFYAGRLASKLRNADAYDSDIVERIMACRNSDGGFGWFEGFSSSPILTSVVLYRMAMLREKGIDIPEELSSSAVNAVEYLDRQFFGEERPLWRGGIPMEQYLHVRSLYASVPLKEKPGPQFRKQASGFLTPSGKRGLNGEILSKTRRILILLNLSGSPEGLALAKSWGIGLNTLPKLRSSMDADIKSLEEYAVSHSDGGVYYPNAVMPWRGLMESELFAHSLLSDLWKKLGKNELSDGIRLWIMLQKETQQWRDDPAFTDALASVMDASEPVLRTRIMALSQKYSKSFDGVKATGNGFTISRVWMKGSEILADGDTLHVGDKLVAKYEIWSKENRSFVRLSAPRPACLRPVEELSGPFFRTFTLFSPQGYRNVKSSVTEYWFDSFPEEKTVITEEFHMTQEGTFTAPAVEIESLYAPHYRANGAFDGNLSTFGN